MNVKYWQDSYLREGRFVLYYNTLSLVSYCGCKDVLEIGPGNGIVSFILRKKGYKVVTVDIDESVEPDFVASVESLPFHDNSFDTVVCCQVLEHLPWDKFSVSLREIRRVTRKWCIISLPHVGSFWFFIAKLPLIGGVWGSIKSPFLKKMDFSTHPEHRWSIGAKGYSDNTVDNTIVESGFRILKSYRPGMYKEYKLYLLQKI